MGILGQSPVGQVAGAAMNPVSAIADAAKNLAGPVINAELPAIQNAASTTTGGAIPPASTPPPMPAQPAPMPTPQQAPPTPQPVSQAPAQGQAPEKPSAIDLLGQLTNNDSSKMQALLASLKDQDKRSQFAQALGVIGDTFGNIGMAKAGMRPEGITTPQMLQGMNEKSKQSQLENLTQSLAADPTSQTSKMAQMTLMQAMGIKNGDPRMTNILKMPASAITQIMPQMNEAVKTQAERERNIIAAKSADLQ